MGLSAQAPIYCSSRILVYCIRVAHDHNRWKNKKPYKREADGKSFNHSAWWLAKYSPRSYRTRVTIISTMLVPAEIDISIHELEILITFTVSAAQMTS